MKRKKKAIAILTSVTLLVSMCFSGSISVFADTTETTELADGQTLEITGDQNSTYVLSTGSADLTMNSATINSTNSGIIVKSGATLNLSLTGDNSITTSNGANAGINVEPGAFLNIEGTGLINITGNNSTAAGIGGNNGQKTGTITINGGTIEISGIGNGAGIGTGNSNDEYTDSACLNDSEIIINNGNITVTKSGGSGASIGGGNHMDGGNITINGGTITTNETIGGGIGSSKMKRTDGTRINIPYTGGNITINGGVVNSTGSVDSAGIGGRMYCNAGIITITGGVINATGNGRGAGIGGGYMGDAEQITITGGTVYAKGGSKDDSDFGRGGAGIGGGGVGRVSGNQTTSFGSAANVSVSGGDITAIGGYKAAGIGTGSSHSSSDSSYPNFTPDQLRAKSSITISGGTYEVYADGIKNAIDYENCTTTISDTTMLTGRLVNDFGDSLGQNGLDETTENTINFENNGTVEQTYTLPVYTAPENKGLRAYRAFACTCNEEATYAVTDASVGEYNLYGYVEATENNYRFINTPSVYHDDMQLIDMQVVHQYTVTYVDGVDGSVFANESTIVDEGSATPEYSGTPTRDGYLFTGWSPAVADTVTGDAVYTATWEEIVVPGPTPTPGPTTPTIPPVALIVTPAPGGGAAVVNIADNATPLGDGANDTTTNIADNATPKGALADAAWALLNLILAILTVLVFVVTPIIGYRKKQKETKTDDEQQQRIDAGQEEEPKAKKRILYYLLGIVVAVVGVVFFIMTEDMSLPMQIIDKWTIWSAIIALVEIVVFVIAIKKKNNEKEDEQNA